MLETILVLLCPLFTVLLLWPIERIKAKQHLIKGREIPILCVESLALSVGLFSSVYLMRPVVALYAPLQIFSVMDLPAPVPVNLFIGFLMIDFANYLSHRLHHKIPLLWRLHRLHHSDKEVDSLSGVLHHPLEIFSTFILLTLFFVMFDIPVVLLVYYAIAQAVVTVWSHSTLILPETVDRYIRYILVTPNMHRIHHSLDILEGNSNFGAIFPAWDRIFGTYTGAMREESGRFLYGISPEQSPPGFTLRSLLINPIV